MIKRDIQDLSSFIRINNFLDLSNESLGLKSGDNVFVLSNLTFYEVLSFNTLLGRDEIKITENLKVKKIITIGDSIGLERTINELTNKINDGLAEKENKIIKNNGFNLTKTSEINNQSEDLLLTAKAGSILKQKIEDVDTRVSNIQLTWERISDKPIALNVDRTDNDVNIPTEGAVFRFVNNRIIDLLNSINPRLSYVDSKIMYLENKPFTYDALLNKPVISDSINSNLSNQIASSKAVKDSNDFTKNNYLSVKELNFNEIDEDYIGFNKVRNLKFPNVILDEAVVLKVNGDINILPNQNGKHNYLALAYGSLFYKGGTSSTSQWKEILTSVKVGNINFFNNTNITLGGDFVAQSVLSLNNVTAFSDKKIKTNIKEIGSVLNKLDKINTYSYEKFGNKEIGVLAQEIKEQFTDLVKETIYEKEKLLTVDYFGLTSILLKAIKELKERIDKIERNG
jgi:putative phage tail fiber repeat-containing domain protein